MARRRKLRGFIGGLGQGVADVAGMMLQSKMIGERQQALAAQNKDAEMLKTVLPKVVSGEMSLDQAVALLGPENAGKLQAMEPPPRRRLAGIGQDIQAATAPEAVPSEAGIRRRMLEKGVETDKATAVRNPSDGFDPLDPLGESIPRGFGGMPIVTGDVEMSPSDLLAELLGEAKGKRDDLMAGLPREAVDSIGPDGSKSTRFLTEREQGAVGPLQTERTTEQESTRQAGIAKGTAQAQADVSNDPKNQAAAARGEAAKASARRTAELKAELNAMGITGQQQTAALTLADDFTKAAADFTAVRRAYVNIRSLASQDSAAADIGLVFNFMRAQDPGSTVREGEQAMAQNAAGVPERVRNIYNKLLTGERLTPEQRQDFVRTSKTLYDTAKTDHDDLKADYTERANTLRVPVHLVVREAPEPPKSPLDILRGGGQ